MIQFNNYQVEKASNYIKLSAEVLLIFDKNGDEDFKFELPECWNLDFLERINIKQFDLYYIYTKTIPYGQYNRITDYKKIWGLNHLEKGEYDNSYNNERGRVYFGIKKDNGPKTLVQNTSSIVLLIPIGKLIDYDKLFNCFKNSQFDFETNDNGDVLSNIQQLFLESFLLRYCLSGIVSMSIYGQNAESLFDSEDIKRWKK